MNGVGDNIDGYDSDSSTESESEDHNIASVHAYQSQEEDEELEYFGKLLLDIIRSFKYKKNVV